MSDGPVFKRYASLAPFRLPLLGACLFGVAPVWWRVNCFRDRHCTAPEGDTEIAPPWSIVDPEGTVRSSISQVRS